MKKKATVYAVDCSGDISIYARRPRRIDEENWSIDGWLMDLCDKQAKQILGAIPPEAIYKLTITTERIK